MLRNYVCSYIRLPVKMRLHKLVKPLSKGLAIIRLFIYAGIYTNLFLLVLGGSIDSAVYIPVSMLPPSTSRNEVVYIPA